MADRMIVITHKDGRRVAVTPRDFSHAKVGPDGKTYADSGFVVESWEGGEAYDAPKPKKGD